MSFDNGNIASFVRYEYSIDNEESAAREFYDSGCTVFDDVIIGYDTAILAHEKTAPLRNGMSVFVRHDD
jgi:hypothetical protein